MAALTVNVTLGNDSVSNAQLENMAQGTIKGRGAGAGTGDPQDLTATQVATILEDEFDPYTPDRPSHDGGDLTFHKFPVYDTVEAQSESATGSDIRNWLNDYFIADGDALSIGLTFPNAGLKMADQNADHTLVLVPNENLTADRQLSIEVNDANRTIDLAGDLTVSAGGATVSGTNTGDQDLSGYVQDGDTLSTGLTFPQNGLGILDGGGDHVLRLQTGENLTADRRIEITVNNANRTIALDGDLTVSASADVSGTNTGDQDLSGLMVKASNLSDVSNTGTARDNLGIITRKVSTATTGVGASYTDVTDLSFMVVAGTTYHINVWILAECSNTGGGVCLSANGPAFTYFAARYEGNQTAGGSIIRSDVTAYDSLGSLAEANSVSAANTPYVFQLQAVLVPSANGTFVARVKRGGGAGNVAVRAGMIVAHAM